MLAGRLIVIPVLNVPAFQADQRESPLDGGNMNRAFAGDATFPPLDRDEWLEVDREPHTLRGPEGFDYAFVTFRRVGVI